jgi:hypothetical protein
LSEPRRQAPRTMLSASVISSLTSARSPTARAAACWSASPNRTAPRPAYPASRTPPPTVRSCASRTSSAMASTRASPASGCARSTLATTRSSSSCVSRAGGPRRTSSRSRVVALLRAQLGRQVPARRQRDPRGLPRRRGRSLVYALIPPGLQVRQRSRPAQIPQDVPGSSRRPPAIPAQRRSKEPALAANPRSFPPSPEPP